MERSEQKENDILAWLILGYLCSHPDAKDTASGIGRWWLHPEGFQADMLRVREALEYLDHRGWLTTRGEGLTVKVYGLKKDRRPSLQHFLANAAL